MAVAGFRNLGCGYDRIENVLWRVTHGELDGYDADRVVIMIGTNNIGFDTDEDIVRGIVNLAAVVKLRQTQCTDRSNGLLPRRGSKSGSLGLMRCWNLRLLQVEQFSGILEYVC